MGFGRRRQVCATTWPERHTGTFFELARGLNEFSITGPTVLEVGPGAVTRWLYDRLQPGEGEKLSWWANRYRALLRNLDGILRRIPNAPLGSYEPGELRRVLGPEARHIVADISPAVVEAVKTQYPQAEARVFDFSAGPFPEPADVVVCLCVLVRANRPEVLFENLYRSLKPGGLLVMDNRSRTRFAGADHALEKFSGQIWRKPPSDIHPIAGSGDCNGKEMPGSDLHGKGLEL